MPLMILPNGKLAMLNGKPVIITQEEFEACCCVGTGTGTAESWCQGCIDNTEASVAIPDIFTPVSGTYCNNCESIANTYILSETDTVQGVSGYACLWAYHTSSFPCRTGVVRWFDIFISRQSIDPLVISAQDGPFPLDLRMRLIVGYGYENFVVVWDADDIASCEDLFSGDGIPFHYAGIEDTGLCTVSPADITVYFTRP